MLGDYNFHFLRSELSSKNVIKRIYEIVSKRLCATKCASEKEEEAIRYYKLVSALISETFLLFFKNMASLVNNINSFVLSSPREE